MVHNLRNAVSYCINFNLFFAVTSIDYPYPNQATLKSNDFSLNEKHTRIPNQSESLDTCTYLPALTKAWGDDEKIGKNKKIA